jgi:hypothetical protein
MTTTNNLNQQTDKKTKTINVLLQTACFLLGAVFVFSGFVKAIDPLGTTYKFEEYFRTFGGFFESFVSISFALSVLLSAIELLIGLSLLLRVQLKFAIYAAFLFMLAMTPLTLYIAIKNPVSDCGCFGDALVISNWATFFKNLVFISFSIVLLIYRSRLKSFFSCRTQLILLPAFLLTGIGLSLYCFHHLPLIDFLPYKVGVNIPNAMTVPENAPVDKYETTFIYAKNGIQKEFTLQNYPKGDSTWKFVDQKTVIVTEGYKAPIHDFSILNEHFEDITEQVLYDTGSTYLLIMYDLKQSSPKGIAKTEALYQKSILTGANFYALTASSDEEVLAFKSANKVTYPFCKTDPTTLKTMIRANPGLILIKNGTITGKWNWSDF